jgi:hypothetical protein
MDKTTAMNPGLRHKGPVQLRFDGGKVVITPEDQDRFVLAADQAVEACQMMNAGLQLREKFAQEFLKRCSAPLKLDRQTAFLMA